MLEQIKIHFQLMKSSSNKRRRYQNTLVEEVEFKDLVENMTRRIEVMLY